MTYTINLNIINQVLPAVAQKDCRNYLTVINIRDDADGWRHYTATNAHVLLTIKEAIEGERLKEPLNLKITKALKCKYQVNAKLNIVDEETAVIIGDEKTAIDIVDCVAPEYERVIPADTTPKAESYAIFDPEYLEIVNKFVGSKTKRPLMETRLSPALWIVEDTKEGIVKKAVLMPMRAED